MARGVDGERLEGGACLGVEEGIGNGGKQFGLVHSAAPEVPLCMENRLKMNEFKFHCRCEAGG